MANSAWAGSLGTFAANWFWTDFFVSSFQVLVMIEFSVFPVCSSSSSLFLQTYLPNPFPISLYTIKQEDGLSLVYFSGESQRWSAMEYC